MTTLDIARDRARQLSERVKRQRVAVRSAFIVSSTPEGPPPLVSLLRGGRGGEVKVKLLLSMLWIGAKPPHDVSQPARVWAELLGLEDPETKGAARVNAAARRLVEGGFLGVEKRPGQSSRLFLMDETGSGEKYTHPGSYWTKSETVTPAKDAPRYTQLPVDIWVNGWMAKLSGPALTMLMILLEQTRGKTYENLWFSPAVVAKRYAISDVTRRKGVEELAQLRLISVDRVPVGRGTLSDIRKRNTYTLNMSRISQKPEDENVIEKLLPKRNPRQSKRKEADAKLNDLTKVAGGRI